MESLSQAVYLNINETTTNTLNHLRKDKAFYKILLITTLLKYEKEDKI